MNKNFTAAIAFANAMAIAANCPSWAAPNLFLTAAANITKMGINTLDDIRNPGLFKFLSSDGPCCRAGSMDAGLNPDLSWLAMRVIDACGPDGLICDADAPAGYLGYVSANANYMHAMDYLHPVKDVDRVLAYEVIGKNADTGDMLVTAGFCDAASMAHDYDHDGRVWILHDAFTHAVIVAHESLLNLAPANPDEIRDIIDEAAPGLRMPRLVPDDIRCGVDLFMATQAAPLIIGGANSVLFDEQTPRSETAIETDAWYAAQTTTSGNLVRSYFVMDDCGGIRSFGVCAGAEYTGNSQWKVSDADGRELTVPDSDLLLSVYPVDRWFVDTDAELARVRSELKSLTETLSLKPVI